MLLSVTTPLSRAGHGKVEGLSLVWTLSRYVPLASGVGSHWHNLYSCQPAGVFISYFNNLGYT